MTSPVSQKQLAENYIKAWHSGDADTIAALLDEDFVYDGFACDRVIGIPDFRLARAEVAHKLSLEIGDAVIMTSPDANRAAAEVTVRGRYDATIKGWPDASGQDFSVSAVLLFAFEGETISRVSEYPNMNELMRQLSES